MAAEGRSEPPRVRSRPAGPCATWRGQAERLAPYGGRGRDARRARVARRRWRASAATCGRSSTRRCAIEIEDGRHPVVEQLAARDFVPNDVLLDGDESARLLILTGPNMAGKSTYMRQVALHRAAGADGLVRARARRARIGIVDRVFTRVGASDDLARGESTLHGRDARDGHHPPQGDPPLASSCSTRSAAGRPRSTDSRSPGRWPSTCTTRPGCARRSVRDPLPRAHRAAPSCPGACPRGGPRRNDDLVFLHRGGRDGRSYRIQVAARRGDRPRAPSGSSSRARRPRRRRLASTGASSGSSARPARPTGARSAAAAARHRVLDALAALDPERMTPIEALTALDQLRRRLADEPGAQPVVRRLPDAVVKIAAGEVVERPASVVKGLPSRTVSTPGPRASRSRCAAPDASSSR